MLKSRWLRRFFAVLAVLFVLDIAWFFGTRSYLRSDSFQKLIQTPELQFAAKKGYSPWPGYFIFHDFRFVGWSKDSRYGVKADSIAFHINPFLLFKETVRIRSLTIQNVAVDIGKIKEPLAPALLDPSLPPPTPPTPEALAQVEREEAAEEKKPDSEKKEEKWLIEFDHAVLRKVKSFRVYDWSFAGDAQIKASFSTDTEQNFTLESASAKLNGVDVSEKDKKLGRIDTARIYSSIRTFHLEDETFASIRAKVRTRWQVEGQLDEIDSLGAYLRDVEWLKLKGSALKVKGDVSLRDDVWQDESRLAFEVKKLDIGLLGQTIEGEGKLAWNVEKRGMSHIKLDFGRYTLNGGRDGEGEGFELSLKSDDKSAIPKAESWSADILLPKTKVHRLQFLQTYIPKSLQLQLEKGKGTIEGQLKANSRGGPSGGELKVEVKDATIRYKKDLLFTSDLSSKTTLTRFDPIKGQMDISKTGIEISRLDFLEHKGWQGSITLSPVALKLEPKESLKADVTIRGENLRPILAFLVKDKNFPDFVMKAFDLKNPKVDFAIDAQGEKVAIKDFRARGGDLDMKGWFNGDQKDSNARFLVNFKGLTVGYGWTGDKSDWKLTDAKNWFEEKQELNAVR